MLGPLMIGIAGTTLGPDEREWLESPLLGGVILFTRNYSSREQLRELVQSIHEIRSPALLVAVDQEGGRVQRFRDPFVRLPALRSIGRLYEEDPRAAIGLARDAAWIMASELRACDVDISFAPVLDLDRGLADVIGDRAFHRDAEAVCELATAYVRGMREAGMIATAKHFPTHAGARADSHTALAVDRRDYPELVDDLEPYRRLMEAGLRSLMVAHVAFPSLDPLPASLSAWWLKTQLRSQFAYSGAIISDDLSMAGAAVGGSVADRAEKALDAGCDMVLICSDAGAIPDVMRRLDAYNDPASQLRLMRLRGSGDTSWDTLHSSSDWDRALQAMARLESKPELSLEG